MSFKEGRQPATVSVSLSAMIKRCTVLLLQAMRLIYSASMDQSTTSECWQHD
ncbi:MAG TPA: hypothetical protein VFS77_09550 [Pyrinomonadaceae bacterium]|nr:hypothetical protein [Pyrinomonadaceae bacterium]